MNNFIGNQKSRGLSAVKIYHLGFASSSETWSKLLDRSRPNHPDVWLNPFVRLSYMDPSIKFDMHNEQNVNNGGVSVADDLSASEQKFFSPPLSRSSRNETLRVYLCAICMHMHLWTVFQDVESPFINIMKHYWLCSSSVVVPSLMGDLESDW